MRICNLSQVFSRKKIEHEMIDPSSLISHERYRHHRGSVFCLAWSPDDKVLASGSNDKTIKVMKIHEGNESMESEDIKLLVGHTVRDLAFVSKDSRQLLSAGGGDKEVRLWDLSRGESATPIFSMTGHTGNVMTVVYNGDHDEQMALTAGEDGQVFFWDLRQGKAVKQFIMPEQRPIVGLAYDKSSTMFFCGHSDGSITSWDSSSSKMLHDEKLFGDECRSISLSPDGAWLLAGSYDSTFLITNMNDYMKPTLKRKAHRGKILSVGWHSSRPTFLTTSADCTVKLWCIYRV